MVNRRKPPSISDLPAFVPPRRDAAAAFARSVPNLVLLALYTVVFIGAGFFAFSGMT
jgi:hypothetical protein